MAIVNVTPDSFSDGSLHDAPDRAVAHALACLRDGADILDIGGESTRPFARPVPLEEEWRRVGPVLEALVRQCPEAVLSIDTHKPEIARRALLKGVSIVNDIAGSDPAGDMASVVAERGAGLVIMHMKGTPATMQVDPTYQDVVEEVRTFLEARILAAEAAGVPRNRIAVDPGIGFGKSLNDNLLILRNLDRFHDLGCAVLIGTSRKRMIGEITGRSVDRRTAGSVASALHAAHRGAQVVRVHDVAETVDAIRVWRALETGDVGEIG
jgi:dihydropteroate synthase